MSDFLSIARFELRYQVRGAGFIATTLLFFLLTFGATTVEDIQIGASEAVNINSPYAAAQTISIMSVIGMFIPLVFLASGVIRDGVLRTEGTFRSLPVGDRTILLGRYAGGLAATALCFLSVPAGIAVGSLMPWLDSARMGPLDLASPFEAYAVIGLPNLVIAGGFLFTAANLTRSNAAAWIALIALIGAWFVGLNFVGDLDRVETAAVAEPLGVIALAEQTQYWTAAEKNARDVALTGTMLTNRLVWCGVALGLLALNVALPRGLRAPRLRKAKAATAQAPALRPVTLPRAVPAARAGGTQLWRRTAFESMGIVRSLSFWVIMALCVVLSVTSLIGAGEVQGTPSYPVTKIVSFWVVNGFSFVSLAIAIYFTAELAWRERAHRFHELVGATPTPSWAIVAAKYLAVLLVIGAVGLVVFAVTAAWQLALGWTALELGQSATRIVLDLVVPTVLFASLGLFLQALTGNKWAGIGAFLGYIVVSSVMDGMGLNHDLYTYGGGPRGDYSDMDGFGHTLGIRAVWLAYWGLFTGVLIGLSFAMWNRGTLQPLRRRLAGVPRGLRGTGGVLTGLCALGFGAMGAILYYNTNVVNEYVPREAGRDRAEAYEARWRAYEFAPIPKIADVSLEVDLYPDEQRHVSTARLVIENRTDGPIGEVHLDYPRRAEVLSQSVEGGALAEADEANAHYLFALDQPMAPGERREVAVVMEVGNRGIRVGENVSSVLGNGTAVTNGELMPSLGWGASKILGDTQQRRKRGLPEEPRAPALDDARYAEVNFVRPDSDWVRFAATVTTKAGQTAIAPGELQEAASEGGRATYRYEAQAPIQNFFVVLSADYAVAEDTWQGPDGDEVALQVFHHPAHDWNIERVLTAMRTSLDVFTAEFTPYQYGQLRVIEFPSPSTFAQSFPNTIRYDEDFGFLGDFRDPDDLDYLTATTAHEVAHQWFAHQVTVSPVAGSQLIVESLSEYASFLVTEALYGERAVQDALRDSRDRYFRGRANEARGEQPLVSMEGQGYLHYGKGAHVLWALRDRIGEDALHAGIRAFLTEWSLTGDPYPRSVDLIAALREAAGPEHDTLITDLFERIVLHELEASGPEVAQREDGQWAVSFDLDARKLIASADGEEKPEAFGASVQVALLTKKLGDAGRDEDPVLALRDVAVTDGQQRVTVVSPERPAFVTVDPYARLLERRRDDNTLELADAES